MVEEDGIFVEQFDSINVADTRYTADNSTFKTGVNFLYSFKHITQEGEEFFFRNDESNKDHFTSSLFVPIDSVSGTRSGR